MLLSLTSLMLSRRKRKIDHSSQYIIVVGAVDNNIITMLLAATGYTKLKSAKTLASSQPT